LTNPLGQANLPPIMTIHVNIGEAKTRLSELLNAMKRGEQIVIMRAGEPEAELVPARNAHTSTREERARKRKSAFGMYRDAFKGADLSLESLKAERGDPEERFERKFGAPS
jgi:prevent-host-death family protein